MSRVYLIGNIYTRVDGLIRKNHVKEIDKPVWMDVYKRFPPKYDPTFKRTEPDINLRKILYKEDALRSKIHKEFEHELGEFNFQDSQESNSQRLLKSYMEYISQGMSEDEAFNVLKISFRSRTGKNSKEYSEAESNEKFVNVAKGLFLKEPQS